MESTFLNDKKIKKNQLDLIQKEVKIFSTFPAKTLGRAND